MARDITAGGMCYSIEILPFSHHAKQESRHRNIFVNKNELFYVVRVNVKMIEKGVY